MRRNDVLCHINRRQRAECSRKCAAGGLKTLTSLSYLYTGAQGSRCSEPGIGVAVSLYCTFVLTTMKNNSNWPLLFLTQAKIHHIVSKVSVKIYDNRNVFSQHNRDKIAVLTISFIGVSSGKKFAEPYIGLLPSHFTLFPPRWGEKAMPNRTTSTKVIELAMYWYVAK